MAPIAGWYPDPQSSSNLRYWDGSAWTTDVRAADATFGSPAPPPTGSHGSAYDPAAPDVFVPRKSQGGLVVAMVSVAAVLVAGGVIAIIAVANSSDGSSPSNPGQDSILADPQSETADEQERALPDFTTWTIEVPDAWRDVSAIDILTLDGEANETFLGSWNLDGKHNLATNSFAYSYQDLGYYRAGQSVTEIIDVYLEWAFDDIEINRSVTDTITTTHGSELFYQAAWHDCMRSLCSRALFVAKHERDALVVLYYGPDDSQHYIDEILDVLDTSRHIDQ